MRLIPNLSTEQEIALIEEMNSARNLLSFGVNAVRTAEFIDTTRDPIFTTLSIGVEKLLKMALGLSALERTGAWPLRDEMKKLSHGLISMDIALLDVFRVGIPGKEYEPYIRSLLEAVEHDPVWPQLLAALDMYGQSGRFYYLDQLGSAPQKRDTPHGYWVAIEQAALNDPALSARMSAALASNDPSEWSGFIAELNGRIADSVARWWEMVAVLGRHGVLGEGGKVFGFEVHPDMTDPQRTSPTGR